MKEELRKRYEKQDIYDLMMVIESPDDYTETAVEVALEAIQQRDVTDDEIKQIAQTIVEQKCERIMKNFTPYSDQLVPPTSRFLTESECIQCLKKAFDAWLERREGYDIDVWSYAIGGI